LYEAIGYAGDDTSTSTYPEEVSSSSWLTDKYFFLQFVDIDLAIRSNMLHVNIWWEINENDDQ
jgi:hypothetical protein